MHRDVSSSCQVSLKACERLECPDQALRIPSVGLESGVRDMHID